MSKALNRSVGRAATGRAGGLLLSVAVVVVVGCGPRYPVDLHDPDTLPLDGQNVTLYYEPATAPCAGTLAYLDASVAALGKYLDLPLGEPIPYYYTPDPLPCPSGAAGCTIGPPQAVLSCWAKQPSLVHELVHAVKWRAIGLTNSFLEEGLAVSLGQFDSVGLGDTGDSDEDLLTPSALPAEDYDVAGDFVSYLLTRFGPAPFVNLVGTVRPGDAVDKIESAFTGVYGETMTALRADRSQSPLTFYANRIDLPECQAQEPDPRIGQGATVTETVDCATNAVGVSGASAIYVPFDVAADGLYALNFQLDSASSFGIFTCGGGTALRSWDLDANPLVVGYLHAGRYFFELDSASASPQTSSLAVVPVALGTWPSCASIPPITVPSGTQYVYVFSMDDGALEVPFVLEDAATLVTLNAIGNQTLNQLQICATGCGVSCQPDSVIDTRKLAAGATFTLQGTFKGEPKFVGENLQAP